jgi:hypothetical protein
VFYRHTAPGRFGDEIAGIDFIKGGEVSHICQKAGGLKYFVQAVSRLIKNCFRILQLCSAWAEISSGTWPFSGFTGIRPEVQIIPFISYP